ncbi:MAG: hypothetical protein HEQ39_09755 [Rhizobacter sp.]
MANLVFGDPPLGNSPDLVFGADTVADGTLVLATVTGAFAALSFAALVGTVLEVSATGSFAPWTFDASVSYVSNTQRPTVRQVRSSFQQATHGETGLSSSMQQAKPLPMSVMATWQAASGLQSSKAVVWHESTRTPVASRVVFEQAAPVSARTGTPWQNATRAHVSRAAVFEDATAVSARTSMVWQDATRLRNQVRAVMQDATRLHRSVTESGGYATALHAHNSVRFQDARKPPAGMRSQGVVPPNPDACYTPSPNLVFEDEWSATDTGLVFFCENHSGGGGDGPPAQVVVPVRRVYLVINDVELRRVDGNILLPAPRLSMSIDVDSWAWGFNATMHASAAPNLEPAAFGQPVELEARINGVAYRLLAERRSRSREFGRTDISVQGRGLTALLDAPYAPMVNRTNATQRTAQQLVNDVLTVNNVPLGWTVEWGLTDWLVPAGAWSHQGSYMAALTRIAEAAGAYVQPHASAQTLRFLARYPTAPWAWAAVAPDFDLPADLARVEGVEWTERPQYNRVFVSGEGVGVLGQVTRTGTAGDVLAPMVTDALITAPDAARQRGLSILGNSGAQTAITLRIPVLPATGIITPGKFVQYADGSLTRKGIVRSSSVEVALPNVWQTIEVESHG